jgi:hypothetical protein
MKKAAKTVTVKHMGMDGEGPTALQAKLNAVERIEKVLSGPWEPHFLTHRGLVAVVLRQPVAHDKPWGFKVVDLSKDSSATIHHWVDPNYATREEAIRAAAYSLAQCASTYEGLTPFLLASQLTELDHYFAWQAAYATAKSTGKSDQEARQEASEVSFAWQTAYARAIKAGKSDQEARQEASAVHNQPTAAAPEKEADTPEPKTRRKAIRFTAKRTKEAACASMLTAADIKALIQKGYCRTLGKYGLVSRIDRADWKEHMAKEHSPWSIKDGLAWVKVLGATGAEDQFRRVDSRDTLEVGAALGKLFPPSGGTVTGFRERAAV